MGACRLCIVEVSGVGRLLPACTTPVQDGMTRHHQLREADAYRRIAVEFLFSRAQSRLRGLRLQQPLRTAGHGAAARASPACAIRYRYPQLAVDVSHRATCWTTTAASCAPAACASARKSKARTSGTSARAASRTHDRLRHEPAMGQVLELHQLRQVRAGVSHRRAGREGLRRGGDGQSGSQP